MRGAQRPAGPDQHVARRRRPRRRGPARSPGATGRVTSIVPGMVSAVYSTITTASAPSGSAAPVGIATHLPCDTATVGAAPIAHRAGQVEVGGQALGGAVGVGGAHRVAVHGRAGEAGHRRRRAHVGGRHPVQRLGQRDGLDGGAPGRAEPGERLADRPGGEELPVHRSGWSAATVRAGLRAGGGAALVQPQHAHHRAQRDLAQPADGGLAHGLLQPHDVRAAVVVQLRARLDDVAQDRRAPWSSPPGTARTCRTTRCGRSAARWSPRPAGRCPRPARPARPSRASSRPPPAVPKSSGMSSLSGPRKFDDAPPGCTAPTSAAAAHAAGQLDQLARRWCPSARSRRRAARRGRTRRRTSAHRVADALVRPPLRAALAR